MTKHLEEIEEISRLRLGIILLIKELGKQRQLEPIYMYLRDLIEGVDENTIKQNRAYFDNFFKELDKENK